MERSVDVREIDQRGWMPVTGRTLNHAGLRQEVPTFLSRPIGRR
jgi:hypothetical protein